MSGRRKGYNYQKLDIDLSILRSPLSLPDEGVLQIIKCIQSGTSEIRETLLFEVDVIYECRVCRGLFRSLTNLLAHKRIYCQEKFKDTKLEFVPSYSENQTVVVQPEAPEESPADNPHTEREGDGGRAEEGHRETPAKSVIDQMSEGKFEGQSESYQFYTEAVERQQDKDAERTNAVVTLKRIPCNPNAVYQSCVTQKQEGDSNASAQDKKPRPSKDSEDEVDVDSCDEKDFQKYNKRRQSNCSDGASTSHAKEADFSESPDVVTIQPEAASGPMRMNLRQRSGGEVTTPIIISLSQRADCEVKTKTCLICNTVYSSLKTLHFHMINCHSEKRTIFPCLFCGQEFTQMMGVTRHLSRVHHKSKETIEKLRLTLRKKAYSKPLEEIKDGKVEKQEKTEKVVKKKEDVSPSVSKRALHKITMHTVRGGGQPGPVPEGATSFKCIHCGKLFKKQESLDRHASFCFTSQATMGHLSGTDLPKNLHGNIEETMETGSSTDMGRWSTSDLSTEDAKHLCNMIDEETLTCLKCDQSYSNISNLHRHAVRHLGRTRFKCRLCQYTAYNRSECKTHLRRVHPGRVFDECELNDYILDLGQENSKGGSRSRSRSASPSDDASDDSRSKSTPGKPSKYMDHLTTLRTRSGLYIKPRFAVKRKAEDDDWADAEKNDREKRVHRDTCEEDDEGGTDEVNDGGDDSRNVSGSVTEELQPEEIGGHDGNDGKDSDDVFVSDSTDSQDSTYSERQVESIVSVRSSSVRSPSVRSSPTLQNSSPAEIEMRPSTPVHCEASSSSSKSSSFPRVPSLIIKKVSISESCVLQQPLKVSTSDSTASSASAVAAIAAQNMSKGSSRNNSINSAEDHLGRPSSPSCSSRSRDTSPDIMLEQHASKETVQRDWADVWESKSEDGEEEFLGFRLVSEAAQGLAKQPQMATMQTQQRSNLPLILCKIAAAKEQANLQRESQARSQYLASVSSKDLIQEQNTLQNVVPSLCKTDSEVPDQQIGDTNLCKSEVANANSMTENMTNEQDEICMNLKERDTPHARSQSSLFDANLITPGTSASGVKMEAGLVSEMPVKQEVKQNEPLQLPVLAVLAPSGTRTKPNDPANLENNCPDSPNKTDVDLNRSEKLKASKMPVSDSSTVQDAYVEMADLPNRDIGNEDSGVIKEKCVKENSDSEMDHDGDRTECSQDTAVPDKCAASAINVDTGKPCKCQQSGLQTKVKDSCCESLSQSMEIVDEADDGDLSLKCTADILGAKKDDLSDEGLKSDTCSASAQLTLAKDECKSANDNRIEYIVPTSSSHVIYAAPSICTDVSKDPSIDDILSTACVGYSHGRATISDEKVLKASPEAEAGSDERKSDHKEDDAVISDVKVPMNTEAPQIVVEECDNHDADLGKPGDSTTGNWKSGYLIPKIIICPPSVSACSEESDESNEGKRDDQSAECSTSDGKSEATSRSDAVTKEIEIAVEMSAKQPEMDQDSPQDTGINPEMAAEMSEVDQETPQDAAISPEMFAKKREIDQETSQYSLPYCRSTEFHTEVPKDSTTDGETVLQSDTAAETSLETSQETMRRKSTDTSQETAKLSAETLTEKLTDTSQETLTVASPLTETFAEASAGTDKETVTETMSETLTKASTLTDAIAKASTETLTESALISLETSTLTETEILKESDTFQET